MTEQYAGTFHIGLKHAEKFRAVEVVQTRITLHGGVQHQDIRDQTAFPERIGKLLDLVHIAEVGGAEFRQISGFRNGGTEFFTFLHTVKDHFGSERSKLQSGCPSDAPAGACHQRNFT